MNERLKKMDALHHAVHLCHAMPLTPCGKADKAWEASIRFYFNTSWGRAQAGWIENVRLTLGELRRQQVGLKALYRHPIAPIKSIRCKCGLPVKMELETSKLSTGFQEPSSLQLQVGVALIRTGSRWGYQVRSRAGTLYAKE